LGIDQDQKSAQGLKTNTVDAAVWQIYHVS